MTLRRALGMLTLATMIQFIIVGTAAACTAPRRDVGNAASAHTDCAPTPTHTKGGHTDRQGEVPCCAALGSCATAPMAARTIPVAFAGPSSSVATSISERAPRTEAPAPEPPPPRA